MAIPTMLNNISLHTTFLGFANYQQLEPNMGLEVSLLKLDLTEWQAGSVHHLTAQFAEFDITTN
jgi:hypothetical protein